MERLNKLKLILGDTEFTDEELNDFLSIASDEIISWHYPPDTEETDVPTIYQTIQVMAVVVGINGLGAEGETSESVDIVSHHFKYADMLEYIHENVPSYVKVL